MSNRNKKSKLKVPLPPPPVKQEEQQKKSNWFAVLHTILMTIISAASLAVSIHSCNREEITPEKIEIVKEEINQVTQSIKREFNTISPLESVNDEQDAQNYKEFQIKVKTMMLLWDSYEDLDYPSQSVSENIIVLKDKVCKRKRFDKSMLDVIMSIETLYHSDFWENNNVSFPNERRVSQSLSIQKIWITTDSLENNCAIAYLEKLEDKINQHKECSMEMLRESIHDLKSADNDVDSRSRILSFYRLLLEIKNSYEQFKINQI